MRPLPGNELCYLSIREASQILRRRKISPVELLNATLERIERLNPELNAFITIAAERALEDARRAQREIARGKNRGPLHGIPLPIKDNIETQGIRTTAGSKILSHFIPDRDADVVSALRQAGAVIIGKTNLHEFAYGITNENPHYGAARNPWDTTRVSGGSSGGSAVAVASGLGFGSVGTDTGGSIRIPAALCGIVGLKPTFGRVSTRGVVPLSVSLDHVGPLARSVDDVSLLLAAISSKEHPFRAAAASKPKGKSRRARFTLGWPRNFFFDRVDDEVLAAIEAAVKLLEKRGAIVRQISLSAHRRFRRRRHKYRASRSPEFSPKRRLLSRPRRRIRPRRPRPPRARRQNQRRRLFARPRRAPAHRSRIRRRPSRSRRHRRPLRPHPRPAHRRNSSPHPRRRRNRSLRVSPSLPPSKFHRPSSHLHPLRHQPAKACP